MIHEQFPGIVPGRLPFGSGNGYPLLFLVLLAATGLSVTALMFGRRLPGRARAILVRGTLVCSTTLIGLTLSESTVAVYLSWLHRVPRLGMVDAPARQAGVNEDAMIVVVGESSTRGCAVSGTGCRSARSWSGSFASYFPRGCFTSKCRPEPV